MATTEPPKGLDHAGEIAWKCQGIFIRAAVAAGRDIPVVPSLERIAGDLKLLVEKQRHEIRLGLLMEIMNAASAERARGLLLAKMAAEERKKLDDLNEILKGIQQSEIQRQGDADNSSFYPPEKKP